MRHFYRSICWSLAVGMAGLSLAPPGYAEGPYFFQSRPKMPTEELAEAIDDLDKKINFNGTVVVKSPDVWGQARLTKHRQEFEQVMAEQLRTFQPGLNAETSLTDQAFFAEALSIAASRTTGSPASTTPINTAVSNTLISGFEESTSAESDSSMNGVFIRNKPNTLLETDFGGTSTQPVRLELEPEIILDQRKRFLDHLHEIRRINEGDDTADSPGYSLNLVRIPVSILPGDHTREGYGAEVTITAEAHITDELLPTTFRSLVINDVIDQLALPVVTLMDLLWDDIGQYKRSEQDLQAGQEEAKSLLNDISKTQVFILSDNPLSNKFLTQFRDQLRRAFSTPDLYAGSQGMPANQQAVAKQVVDAARASTTRVPNGGPGHMAASAVDAELNVNSYQVDSSYALTANVLALGSTDTKFRETAKQKVLNEKTIQAVYAEVSADSFLRINKQLVNATSALPSAQSRSRRSRHALPPSQLREVIGTRQLIQLILATYDIRDKRGCERPLHLPDVQAYLRSELEAAYDFLSRRTCQVPGAPTGTEGPVTAWEWLQCNPGFVDLATKIRARNGISAQRCDFFNTVHGGNCPWKGNCPSAISTEEFLCPPLPAPVPTLAGQPNERTSGNDCPREPDETCGACNVTEALAWAIVVESLLLNDHLNDDLQRVSQDPNCGCQPGCHYNFYGSNPDPEARQAFANYVRCRWPIHVFALDPVVQSQNVADTFSLRREMQIAVAVALSRRLINVQNLTRMMRRIEFDMRTIALNNTSVAFGHGDDTFGWQFYPRLQTPGVESNAKAFFRDMFVGGPSKDDLLKKQRMEPGIRECVALIVMPSFITHVRFDTCSNWFKLTPHTLSLAGHRDTRPSMERTLAWSKEIRRMQDAASLCMADEHLYRYGETQRLLKRVEQLSHELPLQTLHSMVPYENTLGGFQMFSSGVTDLAPELIGYYGAPGVDPTTDNTLFLVGNHFSVHETRVLAGNRPLDCQLLSREVMQVRVPAGVHTVNRRKVPQMLTAATGDAAQEPCQACADNKCDEPCVEFRLATPYGVSGPLLIPVTNRNCPQPQVRWSIDQYPLTYSYTVSGSTLTITEATYDGDPELRLNVEPALLVPSGNMTLELSLSTLDNQTIAATTKPLSVPYSPGERAYVLNSSLFADFHENIRAAVIKLVKVKGGNVSPTQSTFILRGALTTTGVRIPVANEVTLLVTFNKEGT